ncbi:MAG: hypothetical protein NC917_03255 [Candidatus Omnitrophica bacterium]|nr:hypothetical protein [Candidatus Omnitrophota bacterium]MCM8810649.1 hypothetical protein [Candidatus Omnitrophota bacterium]
MQNLLDSLKNLLQKDERLVSEGELSKLYKNAGKIRRCEDVLLVLQAV